MQVDDDSTSAYLYVVGGRLRNRTLAKVERFAFESQLWETMPYLLEPRGSHGAVLCCGALYAVAGGGLHSNLVTCERLDAGASKVWRGPPYLVGSRNESVSGLSVLPDLGTSPAKLTRFDPDYLHAVGADEAAGKFGAACPGGGGMLRAYLRNWGLGRWHVWHGPHGALRP